MLSIQKICAAAALAGALAAAGCGSSSSSSAGPGGSSSSSVSSGSSSSSVPSGSSSSTASSGSSAAAGALAADARSAATGDIPDNQAFLVYTNNPAGYSIKYPEGWTQSGSGGDVTFRDKNNVVHVVIARGASPTIASVSAQLQALKGSNPTLSFRPPQTIDLGSSKAIKATYTTQSAPNPVTGKRVTLIVDRYALASGGRVAVVDLGTPTGVDNIDAYKKMIRSFSWR
jgi:hypothetical protein